MILELACSGEKQSSSSAMAAASRWVVPSLRKAERCAREALQLAASFGWSPSTLAALRVPCFRPILEVDSSRKEQRIVPSLRKAEQQRGGDSLGRALQLSAAEALFDWSPSAALRVPCFQMVLGVDSSGMVAAFCWRVPSLRNSEQPAGESSRRALQLSAAEALFDWSPPSTSAALRVPCFQPILELVCSGKKLRIVPSLRKSEHRAGKSLGRALQLAACLEALAASTSTSTSAAVGSLRK